MRVTLIRKIPLRKKINSDSVDDEEQKKTKSDKADSDKNNSDSEK